MTFSRRLTPSEIRQHKHWLAEWRSPDVLLKYVDSVSASLGKGVHGSAVLFTQGGIEFLRDAQAAGTFAILRNALAVRLGPNPPDFELQLDQGTEQWELTEADLLNRRRGDEYRAKAALCCDERGIVVEDDPWEDWAARAGQIPESLRTVTTKKACKSYAASTKLLIYLNVVTHGEWKSDIEGAFTSSTEAAKDRFDAIWTLWNSRAYEVWRDGKPVRDSI